MIIQLAVWRLWISLAGRIHLGGNCSHGTEWSQAIVSGFGKSRCCVNGRIQQWFGSSYITVYLLCRFFQQQTKIQTWTSWVCSLNSAICLSVCATVRLWLVYLPKITLPQFVRVCYLEAMAEKSFNDQSHDEPHPGIEHGNRKSTRIRSEEAAERKAEKKLRQVPPGWYPHSWFLWMVIPVVVPQNKVIA